MLRQSPSRPPNTNGTQLVFDPNTMKLPDFFEKINQGAEKAFGENAHAMIGSLLYVKLPPKLKRSVNMARLENAAYEVIVTQLERELELNGLEEGDDIPVPTKSTAKTPTRHDRVMDSFPRGLTQGLLAIITKHMPRRTSQILLFRLSTNENALI